MGKTSVSAALAVLAAQRGKRCLVVSTDPAHSLGDVFARALDDSPRRLQPNLDAMEIDPDAEVDAHLARVIDQMRSSTLAELAPSIRVPTTTTRAFDSAASFICHG